MLKKATSGPQAWHQLNYNLANDNYHRFPVVFVKTEKSKPKMNKFGHVRLMAHVVLPPPKNFFLFLYFLVVGFKNIGDYFVDCLSAGMGLNSVSPVENEEPSDSIEITIAVIIDVNY